MSKKKLIACGVLTILSILVIVFCIHTIVKRGSKHEAKIDYHTIQFHPVFEKEETLSEKIERIRGVDKEKSEIISQALRTNSDWKEQVSHIKGIGKATILKIEEVWKSSNTL